MHKKIISLLIVLLALYSSRTVAQKAAPDYRKLHYLSEEEMNTKFDPTRDFYETDPPEGPIRNVAEFDQMQSVLVRYPLDIPVALVREMAEDCRVLTIVSSSSQQQTALNYYQNNNVNTEHCDFLIAPTDSEWTRDYGPWFVFDGNNQPGIVNFPYNRPRPNDNDIPIRVAEYMGIDLYGMNLESTGGNYMCDGMGKAASTDLVWEENPGYSHAEIAGLVEDYLGIENYMVTADPLDEYIKHIDCWGKFLSPGKIILGQVPESDYRYEDYEAIADYFASQISSYGVPYEVYRVFTPGQSQVTPYTNSLILNKKVFVPTTGSQWDDEAIEAYENAMPGYEIIAVPYSGWYNTDALHCRTKGIADIGMLYFKHVPLLGEVPYEESIEISTDLIAYSGEDIYADSVFLIYSVDNGSFDTLLMEHQNGDTWTGTLTGLSGGDQVAYYLFAADESGRRTNSPFIGLPDPFEFEIINNPDDELTMTPDTILFLDYDQMLDGIELNIANNMDIPVTINGITDYGIMFPWQVEEMPDLPYDLPAGETLVLNIICDIPVAAFGELISDTMYVETADNIYKELIMIDSDLLSVSIGNETANVSVYPNPFHGRLNVDFTLNEAEQVFLKIYDLSGKQVYGRAEQYQAGKHVMRINGDALELSHGTYIYSLQTGDQKKTGKIIFR